MKKLIKLLFLTSILTAIVFSIHFLINWISDKNFDVEINNKEKENIEFGFKLENFKVQSDTIRFGDSFGEIMLRNKVFIGGGNRISKFFLKPADLKDLTCGEVVELTQSIST